MTTQLTNEGWSNGTDGRWTTRQDRVRDSEEGIRLSGRFKANTLDGDDIIYGSSEKINGLSISGSLKTGAGNDLVRGVSDQASGLYNENTINTGFENDTIIGSSTNYRGLENQGNISSGDGDDLIVGKSLTQEGITNSGYLDMGSGNDILRGIGVLAALRNDDYISMGKGSDTVDVRRGGLDGNGYLYMGPGFDQLIGFGPQTVDGGGDRDSLFLKQGKYKIADNTDEWGYTYGKTIKDKSGTSMVAISFESIGSILSGEEVNLKNGTLLINAMGEVSYL